PARPGGAEVDAPAAGAPPPLSLLDPPESPLRPRHGRHANTQEREQGVDVGGRAADAGHVVRIGRRDAGLERCASDAHSSGCRATARAVGGEKGTVGKSPTHTREADAQPTGPSALLVRSRAVGTRVASR